MTTEDVPPGSDVRSRTDSEVRSRTDSEVRSRTVMWIAVVFAVVVAAFVALLATRDQGADSVGVEILDEPSPPIDAPTLDGGTYALSSQRGRWVVVNFFASWCAACVDEHPELVEFSERHAAAGDAALVGVSFGDRRSNALAFLEEYGGDWPVVVETESAFSIGLDFGVAKLPESFLIAPSGRVVAHVTGGVTADGLDALIDRFEQAAEGA